MGVVYKAEQRLGSTIRKVAVKTLHAELSRDPSITARFHREVGTVAQLEHPNTVRVYDFGSTDDGTLYIAMEFLDGRALNKVIESEGPLEPKRVAHLLRQVTGSLDEAHRQGIVHRDLKPENVLLMERAGEKDVVKLVDFGIAARTESGDREKEQKLTQQGMVLGTPPYMSPEQFTGKQLDARSDVYSLGVMAYEMLTGQLPFQADTPWQWATHHMTSQPRSFDELPSGSRIPEALRRTVLKSLSKDPHDRQSTAGQFYAEFSAAVAGVSSVAPAVNPRGKTEAMPEATPLAVSATVAMASPLGGHAGVVASPPGPVALPPAPPRETARSNRGLIYGLSGLAGLLLVGIVATQMGGRGGPTAQPLDLTPRPENTPTTTTTVAENPSEDPPLQPDPTPDPGPDKPPAKTTKPAQTTKPASSTSTPTPPSTPPKTTPPASTPSVTPPVTTPTPPPVTSPPPVVKPPPVVTPPPAADSCQACGRAVAAGDFAAARAAHATCSNPAAKSTCAQVAGSKANQVAGRLAKNGNCPGAQQVVDAVVGMGVPRAKFGSALKGCP